MLKQELEHLKKMCKYRKEHSCIGGTWVPSVKVITMLDYYDTTCPDGKKARQNRTLVIAKIIVPLQEELT